jgi:predicted O-linked N-acetylglucosamine transferase (SPINDLY family)
MGTPVVTLPTAHMRGRFSAAIYAKMGWQTLVAKDEAEYVRLALAVGTDKDMRRAARAEIAARAGVLFDDVRVVRAFEDYLEREIAQRA